MSVAVITPFKSQISLNTFYKPALKSVSSSAKAKHFLSSLFTCKCGCCTHRCFSKRQLQRQGVLSFVRAIVLPPFSLCLSTCPLTIVQCAAYGDNRSHTHSGILVKCLREDISIFQTYYTRQSPPRFLKLVSWS